MWLLFNDSRYKRLFFLFVLIATTSLLVGKFQRTQAFSTATTIFINEFHYDDASTDSAEFIEIMGPAGTNLSGWSLILYNGNGGGSYHTINLSGVISDQCNGYGTQALSVAASPGIQNGAPDGFALVNGTTVIQFLSYEGSFTATNSAANGVTSTDIGVAQAGNEIEGSSIQLQGTGSQYSNFIWVETEGATANTMGSCNTGQTISTGDAAPSVSSVSPAHNSIGIATNANISVTFSEPVTLTGNWFTLSCTTSGSHVATVTGGTTTYILDPDTDFVQDETCTLTITAAQVTDEDANDPPDTMASDFTSEFKTQAATVDLIHEIQGSGTTVTGSGPFTVEAVVVADYQSTISGFFIQEEDADADANPATSEGIFVFCSSCPVNVSVGDRVRVNGSASEFNNMSQLSATTTASISVVENNIGLPTPALLTLPVPAAFTKNQYYEQFEGMLVTIQETMTVTELFQLGRFGQVTLAQGGKFEQYTVNNAPNTAGYTADLDQLARRSIVLDDANNLQNADPIFHPQPGGLSASNTLRGGSTITNLTGVLHWSWGGNSASPDTWRIRPVSPQFSYNFTLAPRPTVPTVGGTVRVASFNLLNFFNGDGMGGGFPTPRGAANINEFNRQVPKTVSAICGLNADMVGFMEMENDASGSMSAIHYLVSEVNARCGGAMPYAYIDTGIIGTDEIRVALIYRSGIVNPVGTFMIDTDPIHNRPPLAQTFEQVSTGSRFTVIVNHFKSKTCDATATGGDANTEDGQSCYAARRTQQASRLLTFINSSVIPAAGDPDVLLIGDFNAYASETPITTITSGGYTDLIGGGSAYSYVFDGQWGYLDHALASASLVNQVSGVADWHINADEPSVLDYNTDFKSATQQTTLYAPDAYRSSDHDPVLVGLNLAIPATNTPTDEPTATPTTTPTAEIPTNTPTITATTGVPTNTTVPPTALPTNHPGHVKLKLSAECSPQPSVYRVWRVENKDKTPVTFDWLLLRTAQEATVSVPAKGNLIIRTITTQLPREYMSIWVDGELREVVEGTNKQCK